MPDLQARLRAAAHAAQAFVAEAKGPVKSKVSRPDGRVDRAAADREQHAVHGYGWYATYAEVLTQVAAWIDRLAAEGKLGEVEQLLAQFIVAEYAVQMVGGIPMNQGEIVRPYAIGLSDEQIGRFWSTVAPLHAAGSTQAVKTRIADLLAHSRGRPTFEQTGLDETIEMVRDQFHALAEEKVVPFAHDWHLSDQLIPIELIQELGDLGVFGLTVPEEFGGSGMGKTAMCVVSEELSRGYIGVGSLPTRSEIAAELILTGGTDDQKTDWLPKIASAEILPTAVFTEPNTGSDLGSLRTRAVRDGDDYVVTGAKTWITHAARADVMTMLVRTDPATTDYRGLSILLAPKTRMNGDGDFPTPGMSGGEIEVIGYRGMKEYELGFDGFRVPAKNLLGGIEGQGFKQLMATFESARIQTAARAIGVAQCAMEIGLQYALERKQFGGPIFDFPRVHNKLAMMAAEIMAVRQLTYFAARAKDEGKRCDLEAGMAKLLGARVAWAAADNALQIHGGNGFAMEYKISRVLADARILNIFEGAGEIQAQVIARRLLDEGN
ncbi:MAG TPA: acyl-CoA dehydrogenase family protein [Caulobacteraceae bacterium]|nr:acyl-CoA dehydrogenase family protein [Caulobacteraceae bacterium]